VAGRPLSVLSVVWRGADWEFAPTGGRRSLQGRGSVWRRTTAGHPAAESYRGQTVTEQPYARAASHVSTERTGGIRAALAQRYPHLGIDNHDWDTPKPRRRR
jgi:hypothetical protein